MLHVFYAWTWRAKTARDTTTVKSREVTEQLSGVSNNVVTSAIKAWADVQNDGGNPISDVDPVDVCYNQDNRTRKKNLLPGPSAIYITV